MGKKEREAGWAKFIEGLVTGGMEGIEQKRKEKLGSLKWDLMKKLILKKHYPLAEFIAKIDREDMGPKELKKAIEDADTMGQAPVTPTAGKLPTRASQMNELVKQYHGHLLGKINPQTGELYERLPAALEKEVIRYLEQPGMVLQLIDPRFQSGDPFDFNK